MTRGKTPRKSAPSPEVAVQQWPADKVWRRPVAELVPYARNARTHSPEQVLALAASLKEWGWTNPVLVDEQGGIIAGHGRVMAAQSLGMAEVPVMVATGWTEAQKRAYVIADNQLAIGGAGWDADLLAVELDELRELKFDLPLIGFAPGELNDLIGTPNTGFDPDEVPPAPVVPVSRAGDLWLLGKHRLLCGDATSEPDVRKLFGEARPPLMVTDPPYGVDYDADWRNRAVMVKGEKPGEHGSRAIGVVTNDDRADWREAWALFPGDVAYVWSSDRFAFETVRSVVESGFDIRCQIILAKSRFVISRGHYHSQHEPCWYAVRKGATANWQGDRSQTTLWEIEHRKSETGHSAQKPVECISRAIRNHEGDVYDPFVGSGTTIIAAEMTGRACYALEIAPQYVDVSVLRWQQFTGHEATLDGDGRTFEEVKRERIREEAEAETNERSSAVAASEVDERSAKGTVARGRQRGAGRTALRNG